MCGIIKEMEYYPDYILIPYQVISDKRIEPIGEKLYGLIYWYVSMGMHKCFVSNTVLAKLLNASPRTIQNSLDSLEKAKYIQRVYKDKARRHRLQIIPLITFKSQIAMAVIPKKQTEIAVTLDSNLGDHIKNKSKNKELASAKPTQEFSLKEEIKKMEENKRRDLNVIALYFDERMPDIKNREQLYVAIRRHLRAAKSLTCFTDDQILKWVEKAKRQTPEWTLETVTKMLTK